MKRCSRCEATKALTDFGRHSGSRDGLQPWCKACKSDHQRAHRLANLDTVRATGAERERRRRAADPEGARRREREYWAANPEAARERQRRYRLKHPDKVADRLKAWKQANRDHVLEYAKSYGEQNRAQRAENQARRRARILWNTEVIEPIDREAIIARDEGICHLCGTEAPEDEIELDHVIPLSKGGPHTSENLRVSHRSCNRSKHNRIVESVV